MIFSGVLKDKNYSLVAPDQFWKIIRFVARQHILSQFSRLLLFSLFLETINCFTKRFFAKIKGHSKAVLTSGPAVVILYV